MSTDQSEQPKVGYEFEPFETIFLRRRDDLLKLVDVAGLALRRMEGAARLSEVLKRPEVQIEHTRKMEKIAHEEVTADFPLLHSAATVLIWGALETAFRDFLVRWLARHPAYLTITEFNSVRVRVSEYESHEGEDKMRFLIGMLERDLASSLKPGVGRYTSLLRPFGIVPKISKKLRQDLSELAAVRNTIVHSAGIADARFVQLCPWLGFKKGDAIVVRGDAFVRYVNATGAFAAAIVLATQKVPERPLSAAS